MGIHETSADNGANFDLTKAKNDFINLSKAIRSGNLNEAKKAYSDLQADFESAGFREEQSN
jgi:virulence-associated protein VapD